MKNLDGATIIKRRPSASSPALCLADQFWRLVPRSQFVTRYGDASSQLEKNIKAAVQSRVRAADAMALVFTPPPVASGEPLFFPDFPVRAAARCALPYFCRPPTVSLTRPVGRGGAHLLLHPAPFSAAARRIPNTAPKRRSHNAPAMQAYAEPVMESLDATNIAVLNVVQPEEKKVRGANGSGPPPPGE